VFVPERGSEVESACSQTTVFVFIIFFFGCRYFVSLVLEGERVIVFCDAAVVCRGHDEMKRISIVPVVVVAMVLYVCVPLLHLFVSSFLFPLCFFGNE
jgi:hypothetical protein